MILAIIFNFIEFYAVTKVFKKIERAYLVFI